jgi:hypothetical protein
VSDANLTPPLLLGPRARAGLAAVRARARLSLAVRGGASVALLLVSLGLLSFGLDRLLRLDWGSRAAILVIALTMLGALAWSRLGRPLLAALPDDELARIVEGRHPALEWRLLSAVQFADPAWAPGPETSRDLAALVIQDAEERARGVDFGGVVPGGPVAQAAARGLVVLLAAGLLVQGFPGAARTWLLRDVLLSTTARWPQDTLLRVEGLDDDHRTLVVPHGSDVTISAIASGVVPGRVYLEAEGDPDPEAPPGTPGRNDLLALDALGADPQGGARFRAVLDDVTAGFRFTVRGGDAEVGPYEVRVIKRPWVQGLTFHVEPPPHTKLPARTFDVDAGSVSLPVGTRVHLEARVTKPLASVRITERAVGVADDVAQVDTSTTTPTGFAADLVLGRTALFQVDVEDQDGLGLAAPVRFSLVATPDEAPDVRLTLAGVGLNVTPQATVRVKVAARDDYEVARARLRLKVGAGAGADREEATPLAALAGKASGEVETALDLSALSLAPKMSLTLWGEATDGDPRGPNTGSSPAVQLRVVTPEQLLGELLRRIHEQRLELERMTLEEERLAQGLSGQDKATLERAPRAHRDVSRAVLRAADVVDGVVEEMVSNRLLDATTWDRLKNLVSKPLRDLDQGALGRARDLAEAAGHAPEADLPKASLAAGTASAEVAAALREIVSHMGRVEELAELVATLKRLIDEERALLEKTRRERGH